MNDIGLEGEQLDAFNRVVDFLVNGFSRTEKTLVFSAPGGCGKSYVLRKVLRFLENEFFRVAVVAFTGRAAMQLEDDGIKAQTCHSLLYKPRFDNKGVLVGWEKKETREILEACANGIIVDESSMIPKEMHEIFMSLNVPIVYTGDDAQLPPVDKEDTDFNAMLVLPSSKGVVKLQENRRFDVTNGIGFVTNHLRTNNSIPRVKKEALYFVRKSDVLTEKFHRTNQYDVVICGTNKIRKKLNNLIRSARGYNETVPDVGERVVCLRNMATVDGAKVNNGELFIVKAVFPGEHASNLIVESEKGLSITVKVMNETWITEEAPMVRDNQSVFSFGYGYALSCHKCQGSTFPRVLFVDEDVSYFLDQQKFRYTGCSRAATSLTIAI